jgi:hypothetical protein
MMRNRASLRARRILCFFSSGPLIFTPQGNRSEIRALISPQVGDNSQPAGRSGWRREFGDAVIFRSDLSFYGRLNFSHREEPNRDG